jgi:hypothetical protein
MLIKSTLLSVVLLVLVMLIFQTPKYYQGPTFDHFDGTRFFNPGKPMDKGFRDLIKWRWTRQPQTWPAYSELPFTDKPPQQVAPSLLSGTAVTATAIISGRPATNLKNSGWPSCPSVPMNPAGSWPTIS